MANKSQWGHLYKYLVLTSPPKQLDGLSGTFQEILLMVSCFTLATLKGRVKYILKNAPK